MGSAHGTLEQRDGHGYSRGPAGVAGGCGIGGIDCVRQHFQFAFGASDGTKPRIDDAPGSRRGKKPAGAADVDGRLAIGRIGRSRGIAAGTLDADDDRQFRTERHSAAGERGAERPSDVVHDGGLINVRPYLWLDSGAAVLTPGRERVGPSIGIVAAGSATVTGVSPNRGDGSLDDASGRSGLARTQLCWTSGGESSSANTFSTTSPGFDASGVLTINVSVPDARYKNSQSLEVYWTQAVQQVRALPGVAAVGAVTPLPLSGDNFSSSFSVEGRTIPDKDEPSAEIRVATPDYFRAMKISVQQGRGFTEADRLGGARVLLASERAARQFFPDGNAIGQRLRFGAKGGYERNEGEIVGIVGDVRHDGMDTPAPPIVYVPLMQAGMDAATLVIRGEGIAGVAQEARKQLQGIDREALVGEAVPLEDLVSGSLGQRRFYMMLLGGFATLALALAAVGLYGVISYSAAQRPQEIGIRVALGATRSEVLGLIIRQGMKVAGVGLMVGLALALILSRAMKSLLVGVSTSDPIALGVSAGVLLVVAVLACFVPARRATRVDPVVALRFD